MDKFINPNSRKEAIQLKDQRPKSKEEAEALRGQYFYTGIPCNHGHDSPRDIKALNQCIQCLISKNESRKDDPMNWVENARQAERKARRIARELGQLPENYDEYKCQNIYIRAAWMKQQDGLDYEVDHFTPLSQGGLHTEANLRIMPSVMNKQKQSEDGAVCPFWQSIDDALLRLTHGENATEKPEDG